MLQLLALVLALSVSAPHPQGRFVVVDEAEGALGVIDLNTIAREGDEVSALSLLAFSGPKSVGGRDVWIVQGEVQANCANRQGRLGRMAFFTRDLQFVDQDDGSDRDWETPAAESRRELMVQILCGDVSRDATVGDFRSLAESYWARAEEPNPNRI